MQYQNELIEISELSSLFSVVIIPTIFVTFIFGTFSGGNDPLQPYKNCARLTGFLNTDCISYLLPIV